MDYKRPNTYTLFKGFHKYTIDFTMISQINKALDIQKEPINAYKKEIQELIQEREEIYIISEALKREVPIVLVISSNIARAEINKMTQQFIKLKL